MINVHFYTSNKDIIDHFTDANEDQMAKSKMKKMLKLFCEHVWIEKLDSEQESSSRPGKDWYRIVRDLREFVNVYVDGAACLSTENESNYDDIVSIRDIPNGPSIVFDDSDVSSSIHSASSYNGCNEDSTSHTDSETVSPSLCHGHRKRKFSDVWSKVLEVTRGA
jgi:hypothetical protein